MPENLWLSGSHKIDAGTSLVVDTSRITERDQAVGHCGIRHVVESACADDLACRRTQGTNTISPEGDDLFGSAANQVCGHEQCGGELVRLLFYQWLR